MNIAPKLTADEFRDLHNGICKIRGGIRALEGIISASLLVDLTNGMTLIEKGLGSAYKQDHDAHEDKSDHYTAVGNLKGFASIWSAYDVTDLNSEHPFKGATTVLYKDHWGPNPIEVKIKGPLWVDLWAAADKAIAKSGDNHHVFVESFHPDKKGKKPNVLVLGTGS